MDFPFRLWHRADQLTDQLILYRFFFVADDSLMKTNEWKLVAMSLLVPVSFLFFFLFAAVGQSSSKLSKLYGDGCEASNEHGKRTGHFSRQSEPLRDVVEGTGSVGFDAGHTDGVRWPSPRRNMETLLPRKRKGKPTPTGCLVVDLRFDFRRTHTKMKEDSVLWHPTSPSVRLFWRIYWWLDPFGCGFFFCSRNSDFVEKISFSRMMLVFFFSFFSAETKKNVPRFGFCFFFRPVESFLLENANRKWFFFCIIRNKNKERLRLLLGLDS